MMDVDRETGPYTTLIRDSRIQMIGSGNSKNILWVKGLKMVRFTSEDVIVIHDLQSFRPSDDGVTAAKL